MYNINHLTIEEKIAQMILIDFSGFKLEEKVIKHFSRYKWGGTILFKKNLKQYNQTKKLVRDLQKLSIKNLNIPLLVSVDQEGGSICPLVFSRANHPGNMAMAVADDEGFIKKTAKFTAQELRHLGFNVTYAPVCDVNTNAMNPIVGVRSFGQDVKKVAKYCAAVTKTLQENGVCACGKHFPGHGDTSFDSHLELAKLNHDLEYIQKVDLVPFKAVINAGIWMMMTTHILFPALDKKLPATLSKNILTGLLREKLGFNGIIITDSLQMKAIKDNYGFDEAAVMAVKAGADIVMALGTFEEQIKSYDGILEAYNKGKISEERINESVRRILALKEKLNKQKSAGKLNPKMAEKLYYEIAKKSITLVKNDKKLIPLDSKNKKIGFVYPDKLILGYDFTKYLPKNKNVIKIGYNNESIKAKKQAYLEFAKKCDVLVIITCKRVRLDDDYKKLFNELNRINDNTVIASVYHSYHVLDINNAHTYIMTYSFTPESVDILVKTLFGANKPVGVLPHDIPDVAKMGFGLGCK